jgi:signal transduction histidine kinase/uncharacterized protein YdeI (BOF family)
MMFLQDNTGAAFVESSVPVGDLSWNVPTGEIIEVEGVTSAGPMQCNIHERTLRPVSQGELPKPKVFTGDESLTNLDSQWVTARGVITSAQSQGRKLNFALRVGRSRRVYLSVLQGNPVTGATLIGCVAQASGVCGLDLDAGGHPTGANMFWTPDLAQIQKLSSVPVTPIAKLAPLDSSAPTPLARIHGNVISQSVGDFLFVRDDSGSVRVNTSDRPAFGAGSPVEVFGLPTQEGDALVLNDATILSLAPQPESATAAAVPADAADKNLPALTQISQIRNLPAADAARGYPVRVTGVLTYSDKLNGLEFIQDRSGGIYIDPMHKKFESFPEAGRIVEITGFSGPGDYAPVIEVEDLRELGQGTLPKPRAVSTQMLMTGSQDSQWISLSGVIRRQALDDNTTVLDLATGDGTFKVVVPNAPEHPAPRSYVDAWVEVRGVCGSVFDNQRHLQGVKIFTPDWDQVRTWSDGPDDPFTLPTRSISELLEFRPAADGLHRSHVRGTISLRQADGSFYLQDATGGILVQPATVRGLIEPGQAVDLVGFPSIVNKWPVLQEAEARAMGQAPNLEPTNLDSKTPLSAGLHGRLVRLQARVIGHSSSASEETLTLQFGPWITDAILERDEPVERLGQIKTGSTVDLTGVYLARIDDNQAVQSFQLQLRSPADVNVLSEPAWWTAGRALWLFAALGMAFGLALAWNALLRKQVLDRTRALRAEIDERKRMEEQMERTHKELLIASRGAGMAEVATSVLHNVGNVLNSVNVSANLIVEATKNSDLAGLSRVSALVREHAQNLPAFLADNPKGRQLPKYLELLAERHQAGQKTVLAELESLTRNVNHINDIVSMQQNYAKKIGVTETIPATTLMEDALQMNRDALSRHDISIAREYGADVPEITVDKHKALQILVNLISNARLACQESNRPDKSVTARVSRQGDRVRITVADNGVGIAPENMTRIFSHGFTTRKEGHGFGLHSGALAAKELGGVLTVHSDGIGKGAAFTLDLPLQPPSAKASKSAPKPATSGAGNFPAGMTVAGAPA